MKKFMIIVLLALPAILLGQTTTENYVKSTTYLVPVQDGQQTNVDAFNKIEGVSYYDGLGRPAQTIAQRAGGDNQDIITIQEYDGLGRAPKQYLPLPISSNAGNFKIGNIPVEINDYYSSKFPQDIINSGLINAYNEVLYEDSWESRPIKQSPPGASWLMSLNSNSDHNLKKEYTANTRSTISEGNSLIADDVALFKVVYPNDDLMNPTLIHDGFFNAGILRKIIVKDENWTPTSDNDHTVEEYMNDRGQLLLKRTFNNNIAFDTYYVYDRHNNLSYVVSPEGSTAILTGPNAGVTSIKLDQWCYQYKYDYRNRLIHKKIPGKGWEYTVYDKLDRPVLVQNKNMRDNNQWLFTKYDVFNRPIYMGLYQPTIVVDFVSLQNTVNAQSNFNEIWTSNSSNIGGVNTYYSNQVFPTIDITLHSINYFDDYTSQALQILPASIYNQTVISNVKSLPTETKVKVLGTSDWISTVTGYDYKHRPIFKAELNSYLDTQDITKSLLDFTGKILETRTEHQKNNQPTIVTKDFFTYDHQQRLLTHMQQVDDEALQLIANNTYDEIGQLVTKDVGGALFESGYTNLVRIAVSEDGVITKTDPSNSFNAGMATVGKLEGNGGLSFKMLTPDATLIVGLNDTNTSHSSPFDGNYLLRFDDDNNGNGYRCRVFIRPLAGGSAILKATRYYQDGDNTFAIEREGNNLNYIHNGEVFYSEAIEDPSIALIGDIGFSSPHSSISNLNFYATTIDKRLQQVDYTYNIRGWITDINNVDDASREPKLFNFRINYNGAIQGTSANDGAVPLYNGNISQTTWRTLSADPDIEMRTYGYEYDALNRLKAAYSYKGNRLDVADKYGLEGIDYDKNGNINTLLRYGYTSNATEIMDNLVYSYLGNQLLNVIDLSTDSIKREGFYDGNITQNNDYEYDGNGNMIIDRNKGISNITYNHLNLPVTVAINTSSDPNGVAQQGTIEYVYDATGIKLEKRVSKQSQPIIYTRYAGPYIYEEQGGVETLKMFAHPEGYVEPVAGTSKSIGKFNTLTGSSYSGYLYAFNYTDHLGNIRLTYADSDGDGAIEPKTEVISEKHYYPFGLKQKGYNNVMTSNANDMAEKFAFGGNELGQELGLDWYDISARNYDPAIGRWFNIDPLSEQMRRHSPYNYSFDNPVFFIDADGMAPTSCNYCSGGIYSVSGGSGESAFDSEEDEENQGDEEESEDSNTSNNTQVNTEGQNSSETEEENPSQVEGSSEGECCKWLKDLVDKILGSIEYQGFHSSDDPNEYWYGNDGFTYVVTENNEFYKIGYGSYELVDELPPQGIFIPVGGPGGGAKGVKGIISMGKASKSTVVYFAKEGVRVVYVGITNNFAVRAATHLRTKGIRIEKIPGFENLSRADARAVEQVLIEYFGLGKNGGSLLNRINSIAEKRSHYGEALKRGYELLESIGFKG